MHYSEYTGPWNWPNFTPQEIACRHCGEMVVDEESLDALQLLRDACGKPIQLTSAHRCEDHNRNVGGTPNSQHLKLAFDCVCPKADQPLFIAAAEAAGFTGIGRYPSRGFVHLDCGPKRRWTGK